MNNNNSNDHYGILSAAEIKQLLHQQKDKLIECGIFSALNNYIQNEEANSNQNNANSNQNNAEQDDLGQAYKYTGINSDNDNCCNGLMDSDDKDDGYDLNSSTKNYDNDTESSNYLAIASSSGSLSNNSSIVSSISSKNSSIHRRHNFHFTVAEKFLIVQEYLASKKLNETARKYKIHPPALLNWHKNIDKLHETAMKNPKAKTCNSGKKSSVHDIEQEVWQWVQNNIKKDLVTTTQLIIKKALKIDNDFKNKRVTVINRWVYSFMERWRLSVRRITHLGQKLSGHLQSVRVDFTGAINKRFEKNGSLSYVTPAFFLNMDQTCVYFESKHSTTICNTGMFIILRILYFEYVSCTNIYYLQL
jgi:Tc5 transposase DNA-binding domain